jgi:hypothetical protein
VQQPALCQYACPESCTGDRRIAVTCEIDTDRRHTKIIRRDKRPAIELFSFWNLRIEIPSSSCVCTKIVVVCNEEKFRAGAEAD